MGRQIWTVTNVFYDLLWPRRHQVCNWGMKNWFIFVYHFWIFFLKLILKVLVMIISLIKILATICRYKFYRNHSEFVSFHHCIFKMAFIPKVCSFRVHNSVLKSFSRPSDILLIHYSFVDIDFWHCSNLQHAGLCYQNEMRKKYRKLDCQ